MKDNNGTEMKMKWETPALTVRDVGKDTESGGEASGDMTGLSEAVPS